MSSVLNNTINWHSPLFVYEGPWRNGYTLGGGSVTFPFVGENIKLVGTGNRTNYDVEIDGVAQPDAASRPIGQGDWPSNLAPCQGSAPGQCVVLAELSGLDPAELHNIRLTVKGDEVLQIVSATISADTGVKGFTTSAQNANGSSPRIVWAGDWGDVSMEDTLFKQSRNAGDTATFQFKGYNLQVFGSTSPGMSTYQVSLDGIQQTVKWTFVGDGNNWAALYQRVGLDQTQEHELIITNTQALNLTIRTFFVDVVNELPIIGTSTPQGSTQTSNGTPTSASTPSPASQSTSAPEEDNKRGNSVGAGAIAGIVIGSIAGVAILAIIALLFFKRRKSKQSTTVPAHYPPVPASTEQNRANPSSDMQSQGFVSHYLSQSPVTPPAASYAPSGTTSSPVPNLYAPTQLSSSTDRTSESLPRLPGSGWVLGPVQQAQPLEQVFSPYNAPTELGSEHEDRLKTDWLLRRLALSGPDRGASPGLGPPAYTR